MNRATLLRVLRMAILAALVLLPFTAGVLAHNHPSGDPTPSEADIRITRALREVAKVLDVPLLDHVIVGNRSTAYPEGWFSFKAAGYL